MMRVAGAETSTIDFSNFKRVILHEDGPFARSLSKFPTFKTEVPSSISQRIQWQRRREKRSGLAKLVGITNRQNIE
jgi:hypothetical protein